MVCYLTVSPFRRTAPNSPAISAPAGTEHVLNNAGSIWKGIGIGAALTAGAVTLLLWLSSRVTCCGGQWTYENVWFGTILIIGIVQLLWMLPAGLVFFKK